ncbi:MAG: signal peptide peptidase SppA, partial [Cetobacterium sp.]
TKKVAITKKSFLQIDLSKSFNENLVISPLDFNSNKINFYQLLKKIKSSKNDSNVEGLVFLLDNNLLTKNQISELGDTLNEFKTSNKPIYSYGSLIDNNSLLLSSYSTESFMPPSASTSVNITGYSKEIPYFKNLAQKLGIDVNVIHVGNFKTYGENYVRSEISEENRLDLKRVLDKSYSYFIQDLSKNLSLDFNSVNNLILNGDLMGESSQSLKKYNMITTLKYWEDFKVENKIENITNIENYLSSTSSNFSSNKIAIIYAEGEINYNGNNNLSSESITPDKFISALNTASKDDSIKGIVIRVNSPGGSALASDIIYNSIKKVEKPVYISIGNVAASGGYYISTAGKKIFADKNSITGSIGVVSLIPNFKNLTEKVGVNINNLSFGKYSDLYSVTSEMTEERKQKIYSSNFKVYEEFLSKVSVGRNLSLEEVEKIAQGKIWLGEEALDNGLIDSIGGINKTIQTLADDLNISDNYIIAEIAYEEDLKSIFESTFMPIQKMFSFNILKNSENIQNFIKKEDIFFKPLLYSEF